MKKTSITIIVSLLFCLKGFSQIEGDVRNNNDDRISKAVIIVMDTTKNIIDSVSSDEDGFYFFSNLKPGKYFIEAKAQGFEDRSYKNVIVREPISDPLKGKDQSNATRLQIVLTPVKK